MSAAAPLAGLTVLEVSSFIAGRLGFLAEAQVNGTEALLAPWFAGRPLADVEQTAVSGRRRKDEGEQSDLEAGMAKYLASEYCKEVVEDALRIHGGYGYSQEYEIERLYRDAPMLLIGEGTAEIQKMIIGRRLLDRFKTASS